MARLTDQQIQEANNKSIESYISKSNLQTIKAGKTLKVEGYGGLYINPVENKWNCFSTNKGGGIIQLVMFLEDKSWREAIESLLDESIGNEIKPIKFEEREIVKKDLQLPDKNNTYRHMIAYLIKTRKIDKDIVYKFIKENKLYEDKRRNCVFVGYDKNNNPKYAGLRGSNDRYRFRGDVESSDKSYSFNTINKDSKDLYVFESPIEMMSYMTLYKNINRIDFDSNAISLSSVSDVALERFLKESEINIENIILCLNNDKAGIEASGQIADKYLSGYNISMEFPILEDWNDELKESYLKFIASENTFIESDWDLEL